MITEEEKQEIIGLAVEKALLMLPEVIGNLMTNHASMAKINSKFYKDYPEFKDKKDIVISVIEMIDGRDPTSKYEDILKEAVPEIRKRISLTNTLDTKNVDSQSNRDYKNFDPSFGVPDISSNGEI